MINDTKAAPATDRDWQEWHIPVSTIRQAVRAHFESLGYEVKSSSLRIYGYGEERGPDLEAFQGHIALRRPDKNTTLCPK